MQLQHGSVSDLLEQHVPLSQGQPGMEKSYACRLVGRVKDEVQGARYLLSPVGKGLALIAFGTQLLSWDKRHTGRRSKLSMVLSSVCLCTSLLT